MSEDSCHSLLATDQPPGSRDKFTEKTRTCAQVIAEMLKAVDVTYLFGIPGGPILPLVAELSHQGALIPILAKHEQGAAMMADGYSRVSRHVGVCFTTTGPGATNAVTAVASAQADSIPLLLLTGEIAQNIFGKGGLQEGTGVGRRLNLVELYQSVTKFSAMVPCAEQTAFMVATALRHAMTGRRGAVHLSLPANVYRMPAGNALGQTSAIANPPCCVPETTALERAARTLAHADYPCILAGHGVNLSKAWQSIQRLAEMLSAPIATTLKGKGAFREDHPLSLGVFGLGVSQRADALLLSNTPDVLLIVGSSLGEWQTSNWDPALAVNRTVIQIDIDPTEIGKNYPVDIALIGDLAPSLRLLCDAITQHGRTQKTSPVYHQPPANIRARDLQGDAAVLLPQAVTASLCERAGKHAILFVDAGNCLSWAGEFYTTSIPGRFHVGIGMGTMGHAVPAAIGGKLAAPQLPVVALVGDASFMMTGVEVHTAVEYRVAVIWIVLNNSGHGMVHNGEKLLYGKPIFSDFRQAVDIVAFARAMGARAESVSTLDAFEQTLDAALHAHQPFVINVQVDMEQIPSILRHRVGMLKNYFDTSATA